MKRILIFVAIIITVVNSSAQTIDDIGKIVVGVKVLSTATPETISNTIFLQNKLTNLAANAGFTSHGNSAFYMTPSITISDVQTAEGGMKNIYVINGEIYLTIQGGEDCTIYASESFPFKGNGTSKDAAIRNGLQNISYGDMRPFFDSAKSRILEYYNALQDKIFANADMLVQNKDYDAAIACLLTIPEELFEAYQKAFAKACEIYQKRDAYLTKQRAIELKKANNAVLVKARNLMASHEARAALEVLWGYTIAKTEQDNEYQSLLKQAESRITVEEQAALEKERKEYENQKIKEERAYADSRQEYNDNVNYRNRCLDLEEKEIDAKRDIQIEMTNAVKSVAIAYLNKNN